MGRSRKAPSAGPFHTHLLAGHNTEDAKMKLEEMKASKIFALIAARPLIRAVQIADAVDCSIEEVEDELLPHVNRGHLITQDVVGPNLRKATGYSFSADFMKSDIYAAIARSIEVVAPNSATATIPAPISAPAKAIPPAPAGAAPRPHMMTAVTFIREHGQATDEQLHKLLGLKPTEYLSSILANALRNDRLVRHGNLWLLGSNVSPMHIPLSKKEPAAPSPGREAEGHVVQSATANEKCVSVAELTEAAPIAVETLPVATAPLPAPESGFRCGRWSDGDFELQRGGRQLAVLTIDECLVIARMVERDMQLARMAGRAA